MRPISSLVYLMVVMSKEPWIRRTCSILSGMGGHETSLCICVPAKAVARKLCSLAWSVLERRNDRLSNLKNFTNNIIVAANS